MEENEEYKRLKRAYEELQLRVTRFSAVEQELINMRDQLDHELDMYKRLHQFNNAALQEQSGHEFIQLVAESLIDVMEMESAIVLIEREPDQGGTLLFKEGLLFEPEADDELIGSIHALWGLASSKNTVWLEEQHLEPFERLNMYQKALVLEASDTEKSFKVYLVGLISKKNAPLYTQKQTSRMTIFRIFGLQVASLLSNRQKRKKITQQISQIQASDRELKKLSLIATRTKNGVIIADNMGRIEWVNSSFEETSGYTLEEVKGKKPKDFLQGHKTDPEVQQMLSDALREKKSIEVTIVNYRKTGEPYYNLLEITPVFDEQGQHINFIALQKDITSEITFKQEILRINSRFELVTQKSNIGIWEIHLETGKIVWNDILLRLLGLPDDFDGNLIDAWRACLHPEDSERRTKEIEDLLSEKKEMTESNYRIIRYDNQEVRILRGLVIAERNENQELVRLIGTTIDVTEAQLAEKKLKSSEEKYRNIIDNMNLGLVETDLQGNINFANRKFNALTQGAESTSLLLSSEPARALAERANEGKILSFHTVDDSVFEVDLLRNDQSKLHVLVSTAPVTDQQQRTTGFISIYLDITDLKNVQQDVLQKNEELKKINAELDNFVYSISHDLRSPLLSIKGILNLISDSSEISYKNRQFLELANASAERLDGTIQEILDYSRNARLELKLTKFDLEAEVRQVMDDLRFSCPENMHFEVVVNGNPAILSDKYRVQTLLKNVISNAVKYYRASANPPTVKVTIDTTGPDVDLRIEDNGRGIDTKNQQRVFEMFYRATSDVPGTGLGLYICKEIISKLLGSIRLESQPNEGTTVHIRLPHHP